MRLFFFKAIETGIILSIVDAKNNIYMSWNQQALQNRTLDTVEWDFFSKAMETGIILSIADMKKQLLRVFKKGPWSNSSYLSSAPGSSLFPTYYRI